MYDAAANNDDSAIFPAEISREIWQMKYRFQEPERPGPNGRTIPGEIHDTTVADTWRRIARALAANEADPDYWENEFYDVLEGFKFVPAGRIISGAGTNRSVTMFNCFVMGTIPDDMSGIFNMLREAALTMQQGGGIGYDFSTIRPKGTLVRGVGSDASGPLSFMDVWDSMCKTIMSAGSRRGAMMATMRCDHPDIEDFITAKADSARLRMFNLSVLVTDAFMEAVKQDEDWNLTWNGDVLKTVRARDLWNTIMQSTYDFAEPGVIFIDRINHRNPLKYLEEISCTNPCGEQALPPYGACLLGSVNLARLVERPFGENPGIDEDTLRHIVARAVRMMDNVIDVSGFALEQQQTEARNKRRIGLGVTGVADALLMTGLKYGTEDAARQTESWMKTIQHAAYAASVALAREKEPFPLFDAEKHLASPTIQDLDADLRADIARHGLRNGLLTSIAPTGTISLYAGNVSSGIEPVFAYSYNRKVTQKDGSRTEQEVVDYAVKLYRDKFGLVDDSDLPAHFVSAMTLAPLDHVRMQAAAQKWVDNSISKTINCPEDISFKEFKTIYETAFESGCKGCTTYRPNDVTGSMLSVSSDKPKENIPTPAQDRTDPTEPMPRPDILDGRTYKLKWPGYPRAFYITINDMIDDAGNYRPFEIFIETQNVEAQSWITALTRMISAVFRRGGDVTFVAKELRDILDPQGGAWMKGKYINSLIAAIGGLIHDHMITRGYLEPDKKPAEIGGETVASGHTEIQARICPECGDRELVSASGCSTCRSCGFSTCG